MSSSFRQKSSSFFVTAFIGFIIISFMFTGYETMRGTPDTVATVNGENIKFREYQNEYNRQLEFYRQFAGDNLTTQQIEQFGIRDNTINSLISGKLMSQLSERLGALPSNKEISEEIRQLPYFQTNNRFDITRYKNLLQANGLSPAQFESDIRDNLMRQKGQAFFQNIPLSESYLKEVQKYRSKRLESDIVLINKEAMRKNLKIEQSEINDFLNDEQNAKRVQSLFEDRKPSLDRPAQVKARHILLSTQGEAPEEVEKKAQELRKKVTPQNFTSMVKEHSDDPSAAENGGDLGWFGQNGQMVPEFEEAAMKMKKGEISEPIQTDFGLHIIYVEDKREEKIAQFEDYKEEIVTELLQRNKTDELDELYSELKERASRALEASRTSELNRLQQQYGLTFEKDSVINLFDGNTGSVDIPRKELAKLFDNKIHTYEDANQWTMISSTPLEEPNKKESLEAAKELERSIKQPLAQKLQQEAIETLQEQASLKVYSNRVR